MKKSLLAVAVAAALPTFALAQTSNVTMYGVADASIGSQDPGANSRNAITVSTGGQSTSRWGVRGTEDLGGGMAAVFNIEAAVLYDNGGSDAAFWQRRAVVGLQGGMGTFLLGRDYTPGFAAQGATDVMGYGLYGNTLSYTVQPGTFGILTRASNALHYISPNWGGLTVRAAYSAGFTNPEVTLTAAPKIGSLMGVSGVYAAGPLTVQAFYQTLKSLDAGGGGGTANDKQAGIGAGYNFGMFRIVAGYALADPNGANNKHSMFNLGAGVKIGAGELLIQGIQQKIDNSGATGLADPKGTTLGIAYVHPLSKRTNLYANYGQTRNNATAAFNLYASGHAIAPDAVGSDPKGLQFGIRHLF